MKEKIIICPRCKSKEIIKYGRRKIKSQYVQIYQCQQCGNFFSDRKMKYKTYRENVILNGISIYNLGYSLRETKTQLAKRFKTKVPLSTIQSWVKKYKDICRYSGLREEGRVLYSPENLIFSRYFEHKQVYRFQYHKAKLDMCIKSGDQRKLSLLKEYLEWVAQKRENCPGTNSRRLFPHHIFTQESKNPKQRASQTEIERFVVTKVPKNNLTNSLAEYGLKLARSNYERHDKVENFMLINDSVTVAAEVPVYLTNDDIKYFKKKGFQFNFNSNTPITGHIDLIQIRNGLIYILDYKPRARKEKPFEQLISYALALGSRTKLAIKDFKCAWFDEKDYFEFFPLHAVYRKRLREESVNS